jgi:hypothetical protein
VLRILAFTLGGLVLASAAVAQQTANPPSSQPQVKVNVLNARAPSPADQKEMAAALGRIPKQPLFVSDFEISRGRSTLTDTPNFLQPGQSAVVSGEPSVATYVRIRHEFSPQAFFSTVQYSFSNDGQNMVETLVLRVRDAKDLMQVSLEDSASSVTGPADMLAVDNPVSRIRLERFGTSSVALARCTASEGGAPPDQSAYEPLFRSASQVLTNYRALLGVRRTVPEELAKVGSAKAKAAPKSKLRRPLKEQK